MATVMMYLKGKLETVRKQKQESKKRGFTLAELVIVIFIMMTLMAVIVTRSDFLTIKAYEVGLRSEFRNYNVAFEQVAREQSGFSRLTDPGELASLINEYLDPALKLKVTAPTKDSNGAITTAGKGEFLKTVNGTEEEITDPWNTQYFWMLDITDANQPTLALWSAGKDKQFYVKDKVETTGKFKDTVTFTELTNVELEKFEDASDAGYAVNKDNYSMRVRYSETGVISTYTGFSKE